MATVATELALGGATGRTGFLNSGTLGPTALAAHITSMPDNWCKQEMTDDSNTVPAVRLDSWCYQ